MIIGGYLDRHRDQVWRVRRSAFGGPAGPGEGWPGDPAAWRGFVAEVEGRVTGFLRVRRSAQFFGGRSVPMGGVAGVAVEPHARGAGVASGLLGAALAGMHDDGQVISTLFTTVPGLYLSRGWDRAGVVEHVELAPHQLREVARSGRTIVPSPAGWSDETELRACYAAVAVGADGMIDRSTPGVRGPDLADHEVVTRALDEHGAVVGYLVADRDPARPATLVVHDLVAGGGDALRMLLRSLGAFAGLVDLVRVPVAEPDLLAMVLPGSLDGRRAVQSWYLRVVDLPGAVAARGWPAARMLADGSCVDIELQDEHAPWHAGRHRLVVEGGRVHCEPGVGRGTVRMGARALAGWFTGTACSSTLRNAGLLCGDPLAAAVLDALVARPGGPPRMTDAF